MTPCERGYGDFVPGVGLTADTEQARCLEWDVLASVRWLAADQVSTFLVDGGISATYVALNQEDSIGGSMARRTADNG
ncbi:MAG: hypothetical protein WBF75_20895 [Pseudonocardiaceae bacterium]